MLLDKPQDRQGLDDIAEGTRLENENLQGIGGVLE